MTERPPEDREEWLRQTRERLEREEEEQKARKASANGASNGAADLCYADDSDERVGSVIRLTVSCLPIVTGTHCRSRAMQSC